MSGAPTQASRSWYCWDTQGTDAAHTSITGGTHSALCLTEPSVSSPCWSPRRLAHPPQLSGPGTGLPASVLHLHILDDGAFGESQLVVSLGLVVKEGFDCTLQSRETLVKAVPPATADGASRVHTHVLRFPTGAPGAAEATASSPR